MSTPPPPEHDKLGVTIVAPRGMLGSAGRVLYVLARVVLPAVAGAGSMWFAVRPTAFGDASTDPAVIAQRLVSASASDIKRENAALRGRVCELERELRDLEARIVRVSAADAEPRRARKAESGRQAYEEFMRATNRWVCPADRQEHEDMLRQQWYQVLETAPP